MVWSMIFFFLVFTVHLFNICCSLWTLWTKQKKMLNHLGYLRKLISSNKILVMICQVVWQSFVAPNLLVQVFFFFCCNLQTLVLKFLGSAIDPQQTSQGHLYL
jgi:hypothetical protein